MKRFLSALLCFVLITVIFSGCSTEPDNVRILSVENSPSAALAHMIKQSEGNNNYISSTVNLANRVRNLIADGECDIAVVPIETAYTIYKTNSTDIKVLAGISTGGFELVTTESITDFSDLSGKTVYLTERGTIMENVFKYLLSQYGVNPFEEVTFDYASDAKQLEKSFAKNEVSFALLSSAEAASAKATVKNLVSFNITDGLAEKLNNPSIVTYCIIGTTDFINANPKAVKQLLEDTEASISKASDLSATVTAAKESGLLTDEIYSEDFISACKPEFISGEAMKEKFSAYYKLILKINSSLIGNKIPDDNFYYIPQK